MMCWTSIMILTLISSPAWSVTPSAVQLNAVIGGLWSVHPASVRVRGRTTATAAHGLKPHPLDLNQVDIQMSRELHKSDPSLSPLELARRVPISPLQRDLIFWMRDDLEQYVLTHADVWDQHHAKLRKRNPYLSNQKPVVRDPGNASRSADELTDAAARLDQLA